MSEGKKLEGILSETIPEDQWKKIDEIIEKYKYKEGTLIPVLKEIQEVTGFLPREVQQRIAGGLKLHPSQVFGVVTFYSLFTMTPKGRHTIRVCMGTSCYVRGGQQILDQVRKECNVQVNETTPDLRYFSWRR